MNNRKAFTLIELLVVIAIIAILAAILFPIFVTAKERGKIANCTGNLRSIYQAITLYADDNNGCLPRIPCKLNTDSNFWFEQCYGFGDLWKYIKKEQVFLCPNSRPATAATPPAQVETEHVYKLYYDYDASGKTKYARGSYHFWPQLYAAGNAPYAKLDVSVTEPTILLNTSAAISAQKRKRCHELGGPLADNFNHRLSGNKTGDIQGVLMLTLKGQVKFLPADSYPLN